MSGYDAHYTFPSSPSKVASAIKCLWLQFRAPAAFFLHSQRPILDPLGARVWCSGRTSRQLLPEFIREGGRGIYSSSVAVTPRLQEKRESKWRRTFCSKRLTETMKAGDILRRHRKSNLHNYNSSMANRQQTKTQKGTHTKIKRHLD